MGAAVPQSLFAVHCTHALRKQRGAPAGQSAFAAHCTHCCVVGSQIFALTGQSAAVLQPTHAPVLTSQIGCRGPVPHDALLVHAG